MITEKEFKALLDKNPQLKERYNKKTQKEKRKQSPVRAKEKSSANTPAPQNLVSLVEEERRIKLNKYFNVKVYEYETGLIAEEKTVQNAGKIVAVYDSRKEYNRWCELQLLQKGGRIQDLRRQIHMVIQESFLYQGEKIGAIEYVADFVYTENNKTVVEDVKPLDPKTGRHRFTKDFILKWKLLKHRYPEYIFSIF